MLFSSKTRYIGLDFRAFSAFPGIPIMYLLKHNMNNRHGYIEPSCNASQPCIASTGRLQDNTLHTGRSLIRARYDREK